MEHTDETPAATSPPQPDMTNDVQREQTAGGLRALIEIDVADGRLVITGRADQTMLLGVDDTSAQVRQGEHGLLRFARVPDGAELHVTRGTDIVVHRVYGDLSARNIDGALAAHHVNGDVHAIQVAALDLSYIRGDTRIAESGAAQIGSTEGDVELENLGSTPSLGHVGGRLKAVGLPGLHVRDAITGDVVLKQCGEVLIVGSIGGDLRADGAVVTVRSSAVEGDVRVPLLRGATIAAVGGDVTIGRALEQVDISSVGGRVAIGEAQSAVHLGTVGDELLISQAGAGLTARHVYGDVKVATSIGQHATYDVHALGDITIRVSGDIHARFVAQTTQGEIHTRLPLAVERGRRRNLVGVLGRGTATVTLRSERGDIFIAATDSFEKESAMGDEYRGEADRNGEKSWEGTVAGRKFKVRWDKGPGKARVHFQGPFAEEEGANPTDSARDFNFEWERGRGARFSGEYEQKLNELRDKAEKTVRRATEQAQEYAERAAKRARETDWEAVGREVRTAFDRAMSDLEDAFGQFRKEWDTRRPGGQSAPGGSRPSNQAQRVRIEYDDQPAGTEEAAGAPSGTEQAGSMSDGEARRRAILEQLRTGAISIDEAERRLAELG